MVVVVFYVLGIKGWLIIFFLRISRWVVCLVGIVFFIVFKVLRVVAGEGRFFRVICYWVYLDRRGYNFISGEKLSV